MEDPVKQTTTSETQNSYIGRDTEGRRIFVSLEITSVTGQSQMLDHEPIEAWDRVGIDAGAVSRSHRGFETAGQIIDVVRGTTPDKGSSWTVGDIASLVAIWERWNLNDLHAGCEHVPTPVYRIGTYGRPEVDLDKTPECAETGYRYGSAWLVEVVPEEVLAEVRRLAALPRGVVPAYLG
jgi:hypothetical protein